MPHAALWVVQQYSGIKTKEPTVFQCRTRLCGWCSEQVEEAISIAENVSMPHAALWVVQLQ